MTSLYLILLFSVDGLYIKKSESVFKGVSRAVSKDQVFLRKNFLGQGSLCGGKRLEIINAENHDPSKGVGSNVASANNTITASELATQWVTSVVFAKQNKIQRVLFGGRDGAPCPNVLTSERSLECLRTPPIHDIPDPYGELENAVRQNIDISVPVLVEIIERSTADGSSDGEANVQPTAQPTVPNGNFVEVGYFNYSSTATPYVVNYSPKEVVGDDVLQIEGHGIGRASARIGSKRGGGADCTEIHAAASDSEFLAPRSDLLLQCKVGSMPAAATYLQVNDPHTGDACFLPHIESGSLLMPMPNRLRLSGDLGSSDGGDATQSHDPASDAPASDARTSEASSSMNTESLSKKPQHEVLTYNPLFMPIAYGLHVDSVRKKAEVLSSEGQLIEKEARRLIKTYRKTDNPTAYATADLSDLSASTENPTEDDSMPSNVSGSTPMYGLITQSLLTSSSDLLNRAHVAGRVAGVEAHEAVVNRGQQGRRNDMKFSETTGLATGSFGGGNFIKITGQGFDQHDAIQICGQPCKTSTHSFRSFTKSVVDLDGE